MSFVAITTAEADAKSPMDDGLWGKVKNNFDDLNSRVVAAGAAPFVFELQGKLSKLTNYQRSICAAVVNKDFQPTSCRFVLKKSGTSALGFDIRKHTSPRVPITAINPQYAQTVSSIARQGSSLLTQGITRATTQISTQSITFAKGSNAIQSIIPVIGTNLWLYNLASSIDSDTVIGDSITFASCTNTNNNGTFVIVDKNRSGGNNVVVTNASGASQTGIAGTAQLQIMSYNYTNPVSTFFGAGFTAHMAAHTAGANNGELTIYAINQSGNNIWIKNSSGVTQAGSPGTADTNLFIFAMLSAVLTTDYAVGEKALCATHTSGSDNGTFVIAGVNVGGNNVMLHVSGGATQGSAAGTVDTNRWKYLIPVDPTTNINAGDTVYFLGSTNPLNDGVYVTRTITSATIVVYNEAGVAQVSSGGNGYTTKKVVSFAADQSANFTTDSYIEMEGCQDAKYNKAFPIAPFKVLQVNRGGGANYNVVIDNPLAAGSQLSPAGYVQTEMKSIFSSAPTLAADLTSIEPNNNIVGSSTSFVVSTITAGTPVMLYIPTVPSGDPQDLSVILT